MPLVGSVLLFAHFQSSFAQGSPPPQVAATHYTTPTQIKETPDPAPTEYLPTRTLRIQLKEAYGHRSISGNVKICLVTEKRDTMGATQTVVTPIFSSPTNENGFIEWEVPIEYRNKKLSIIASGRYYMQEGTIVDLSRLPESYKYKELVFNRTLKLEGVILGMGGFSGAGKNENGEN
jgi:hypothetical protein